MSDRRVDALSRPVRFFLLTFGFSKKNSEKNYFLPFLLIEFEGEVFIAIFV